MSNKPNYDFLNDYVTLEEYGYEYKWDIYRISKYLILYEMGGFGVDLELIPPLPSVTNIYDIIMAKSFSLQRYLVVFPEKKMTADQYYQLPKSNMLYSTGMMYSSCIKHGFFMKLLENIVFRSYEKYYKKEYVYFYLPQFIQKKQKSQKRFSVINNKIWYDLVGDKNNKIADLKEKKNQCWRKL